LPRADHRRRARPAKETPVTFRISPFADRADEIPRRYRAADRAHARSDFKEAYPMANIRSLAPFGRGSLIRDFDPFTGLRHEMDRMLEDFGRGFPAAMPRGGDGFMLPKVDIAESEAGLELTAELPGFDEKDVSLDIHEGVLTIKAEHNDEREQKDEKKHYHLVERNQGTFLRRFALPFEADAEKAAAHLDKGVLKVFVPRLASGEKKPTAIPVGGKPA
jgi:HSP20 family protein